MSILKDKLAGQLPAFRDEVKAILASHGEQIISSVNIGQAYGGMRDIKCMVCDTSEVDPGTGLIIRGRPVLELTDKLPEEIFWLLLTGELPSEEERKALRADFAARNAVPDYVWRVLDAMP